MKTEDFIKLSMAEKPGTRFCMLIKPPGAVILHLIPKILTLYMLLFGNSEDNPGRLVPEGLIALV